MFIASAQRSCTVFTSSLLIPQAASINIFHRPQRSLAFFNHHGFPQEPTNHNRNRPSPDIQPQHGRHQPPHPTPLPRQPPPPHHPPRLHPSHRPRAPNPLVPDKNYLHHAIRQRPRSQDQRPLDGSPDLGPPPPTNIPPTRCQDELLPLRQRVGRR